MEITINIPDEAVDRIAGAIRSDATAKALERKQKVQFKSEGIEYIKEVLQGNIDAIYVKTDPDFIASRKAIKEANDAALQKTLDKLKATKK